MQKLILLVKKNFGLKAHPGFDRKLLTGTSKFATAASISRDLNSLLSTQNTCRIHKSRSVYFIYRIPTAVFSLVPNSSLDWLTLLTFCDWQPPDFWFSSVIRIEIFNTLRHLLFITHWLFIFTYLVAKSTVGSNQQLPDRQAFLFLNNPQGGKHIPYAPRWSLHSQRKRPDWSNPVFDHDGKE